MAETKGLIRRLVYMTSIRSLFVANIILVIVAVLCGISFRCGNLKIIYEMMRERDPEFEKGFSEMFGLMLAMMNYVVGMMPAAADTEVVMKDIKSGWNRFAYTLPVTTKQYAAANYILTGGLTVFMFVFIALFDLLCFKLFRQPYDPVPVAISILIITVVFVIGRIFYNLVLRVGDSEKAGNIIMYTAVGFILAFPALFILVVAILLPAFGMDEDDIPVLFSRFGHALGHCLWLFPVIVAAVLYLSYRRTVRLLERRAG